MHSEKKKFSKKKKFLPRYPIFSSPGQSPGRANVLPPASALMLALAVAAALAKS